MKTNKEDMKNLGRLKGRSDFLRIQNSGRKWIARHFVLQLDQGTTDHNRFGVTVTKRLDKSAVGRNRMKRRLRAVAYDVLATDKKYGAILGDKHDFVLIARQGLAEAGYDDLKKDLRWCLKKLSMQNNTAS
jgi:ribonuclease P protein component